MKLCYNMETESFSLLEVSCYCKNNKNMKSRTDEHNKRNLINLSSSVDKFAIINFKPVYFN